MKQYGADIDIGEFDRSRLDTAIEWLFITLFLFMPFAFGAESAWSEEVVIALSGMIVVCFLLHRLFHAGQKLVWTWAYVPIGLFALVGVGFLTRRPPSETWKRLGLERVTWRQVVLTVGLALVILVFYYGVDWVWLVLAPENYEMMEALGEVLYGGVMNTWQALVISLVAGVTEELFFRGALQPRFGLLLAAILFTGVHVQYGFTPAALEILSAALVLGWLRQRTNTSTCILLHALYDAAGLLVFPLLP